MASARVFLPRQLPRDAVRVSGRHFNFAACSSRGGVPSNGGSCTRPSRRAPPQRNVFCRQLFSCSITTCGDIRGRPDDTFSRSFSSPPSASSEEKLQQDRQEAYRRSVDPAQREDFWREQAQNIDWRKQGQTILGSSNPPFYRWFPDWELNICENAVDRHLPTRKDQPALIYESPVTNQSRAITYQELFEEVNRVSAMLRDELNVTKGDRVLIYMPMVPEGVFAMLACARLGAVHSVVYGGFSAKELASRIDDAAPRAVLSATCGVLSGTPGSGQKLVEYFPLLEEGLRLATHAPEHVVLLQRTRETVPEGPKIDFSRGIADKRSNFREWGKVLANVPAGFIMILFAADDTKGVVGTSVPPVPTRGTDPLYILYTSGTTGKPKGVLRDCGGHAVVAHWSMGSVMGMEPGDCYFCASDIGWAVGHTYVVYAPLLFGCSSILFEGKPIGTPDAGAYWDVCQKWNAKALFTAPTALRAVRGADPELKSLKDTIAASDKKSPEEFPLRQLFVAGERCDPDTVQFFQKTFDDVFREENRIRVLDNYWMTETGSPIAANDVFGNACVKPGSTGRPVCGWNVELVDEHAGTVVQGQQMSDFSEENKSSSLSVAVRLPLPPGAMPSLYNADERFVETYLRNFKTPDVDSRKYTHFLTGDAGKLDENFYLHIMSRLDDLINCAGHRLSTGAMEAAIIKLPEVVECAVVGLEDKFKGAVPVAYVVVIPGKLGDINNSGKNTVIESGKLLATKVRRAVREAVGAQAVVEHVIVVSCLPKTRSGKTLRKCLRRLVNGEADAQVPGTIEDVNAIEVAREAARRACIDTKSGSR